MAINMHQTEKQKIMRGLARINDFRKNFRYMHEDINGREDMSEEYMRTLAPLMESMFGKLEELSMHSEQKFKNKIFQIVRNQQKNCQDDMKIKLPQFYQRLA